MSNRVDVTLLLRSPQVIYLEYLAERDASSLSSALEWVIRDRMAAIPALIIVNPALKARKTCTLTPECVAYLDRLSGQWGLERSDVVRRIVDDAKMKDEAV